MTRQKARFAEYAQDVSLKFCTWMLSCCRCEEQMRISHSRISTRLGGGSLIRRKHQMFCILSPLAETTDLNWVVHMKKLFQEFLHIWSLIVNDWGMFLPLLNVLLALQVMVLQVFCHCYLLKSVLYSSACQSSRGRQGNSIPFSFREGYEITLHDHCLKTSVLNGATPPKWC